MDFIRQTTIPYVEELAEIFHMDQVREMLFNEDGFRERCRTYPSIIEIRLGGAEKIIRREGNPNILDIACGFTPRGSICQRKDFAMSGPICPLQWK